jgi:hypothetical protein
MRQIVISVEDEAFEPFIGMVRLCPKIEVVGEGVIADVMTNRDEWMKQAIETLRLNRVFRHCYDYTWIMLTINEGWVEEFEEFSSPQAFLDYLCEIGIGDLPNRKTLSAAYSKTFDAYPHWTFRGVQKACEVLRRNNVAKQFLSAYIKAKRHVVDNIVDK